MSLLPWRCRHRTSPECPFRVSAAQVVFVQMFHTLMVLSEEPLACGCHQTGHRTSLGEGRGRSGEGEERGGGGEREGDSYCIV